MLYRIYYLLFIAYVALHGKAAAAGFAAGTFGLLALFARALGGIASDRIAKTKGLDGRTLLLFGLMVGEGLGLLWWAQMDSVAVAIVAALRLFLGGGVL